VSGFGVWSWCVELVCGVGVWRKTEGQDFTPYSGICPEMSLDGRV
jgi:hypothetical protein